MTSMVLTKKATMITQTSAVTFRQNLGEMLNQVGGFKSEVQHLQTL
jgi:hypothetical protein